jgi:hypothetical protein
MVAALAITPASGSITAKSSVCRIDVTGAPVNTATGYSTSVYPQSPAIVYYILIDAPVGTDDGKSYLFSPASDGTHSLMDYTFPVAGSYTLRLRDNADASDKATLAVTVS